MTQQSHNQDQQILNGHVPEISVTPPMFIVAVFTEFIYGTIYGIHLSTMTG